MESEKKHINEKKCTSSTLTPDERRLFDEIRKEDRVMLNALARM